MKLTLIKIAVFVTVFAALVLPVWADLNLNAQVQKMEQSAAIIKAQAMLKGSYAADEILVKYRNSDSRFVKVKVFQNQLTEKLADFLNRKDVEVAEPNYKAEIFYTPNDPYLNYQWHLSKSEISNSWNISTGQNATVAIIDTGVAYLNYNSTYRQAPDLSQTCFVGGYNFVANNNYPLDDHGHGTHLAGIVAQSTDNNLGTAGIAYKACIMPIKALDSSGSGTYSDIIDSIYYATDHGANVINLSLGGTQNSTLLKNAVQYAHDHNVTVVAAVGNSSSSFMPYPAAYNDYVIAVGAVQYDESRASYSNYGSALDLMAPGGNLSQDQNNDGYGDGILQQSFVSSPSSFGYYFREGTSLAAPFVSAVAALLISQNSSLTSSQVQEALQKTAKDLGISGRDNYYGWGLVNAHQALNYFSFENPQSPPTSQDTDNDGVADSQDSCPNLYGTACHGCPNSCSGCAAMSCPQSIAPPVCVAGSCPNTTCPVNGCGVGSCSSDQYGTYQPVANQCLLTNNIGTCANNSCQLACATNSQCQVQGPLIKVADISLSKEVWSFGAFGNYCRVTATVSVADQDSDSLNRVSVTGQWSGAVTKSVSDSTNTSGQVIFRTSFSRTCGDFTFCVTRLNKSGYAYNSTINTETCDQISAP